MRDIFDIMKKDIRNKHISICAELLNTDKRRDDLEDLIDTIMKAHNESPDKIQATASIEKNGYFIRTFEVDASMTEEVYDSIYSIYGGTIEEFKEKVELRISTRDTLGATNISSGSIVWPTPVERTRFRDGVLGQWQEDADGDSFMGFGSFGAPSILISEDGMVSIRAISSDWLEDALSDIDRRIH